MNAISGEEATPDKLHVLYLASTQFSGTTLLSFLLNQHSRIATVGHTTGWRQAREENFLCSCGEPVSNCELFSSVAAAYLRNGLEFTVTDFGTAFRVTHSDTLNYYLTEALPIVQSTFLESLRNNLVALVPVWKKRLHTQFLANQILVSTVLDKMNASVFLDNSHSPYRYHFLARNSSFDVKTIHLVRDPRGVALSMNANSGIPLKQGIRAWIRRQCDILRLTASVRRVTVKYEDLCSDTNRILQTIHKAAGLEFEETSGNFKDSDHHILGNRMRLDPGDIKLDERWRHDLDAAQQQLIDDALEAFATANPSDSLTPIVESYLSS